MCSIYGSIGKNYKNIEQNFSKALHHRGPDDEGVFYDDDKGIVLGHTRLSIIDLSNQAHQPMLIDNYILVFNGEIYNYQEIKKELQAYGYNFMTNSDTEVVLKSFMHWKEDCVKRFRGMFAFCIYDKQKKELFLSRDRFGIKPLIYTFTEDQFIFSSELKPFLKSNIINKKLSIDSVSDFFTYGSVKQPKTILENLFHLLPGHSMTVALNRDYKIKRYYDYVLESQKIPKIESYSEAIKIMREELESSTKYHMVSDVDVGAFLSGGVDSTAIVAMMKNLSNSEINTFSIGFKDGNSTHDETDVASRTAKYLGCKHHNIRIDDNYVFNIFDNFIESMDQPSIDGINTYIVSLETAKKMKVALSGLGGDEIFAGYPHFETIQNYSAKNKTITSYLGEKLNNIRPNRFTNKYGFFGLDEVAATNKQRIINSNLSNILNKYVIETKSLTYEGLSPIQKISKSEIDGYMLNTLLRDNDINSMSHSLEVRPVLLDHKLLELAFSLSDEFKVRDGMLKSIFIDSMKDLIPNEVWSRRKTGFEMPFKSWMNGRMNEKFMKAINTNKAPKIFKDSFLASLNTRIVNRNLNSLDWMSLVFLSWLDQYEVEI
jgi:asparagine synthase (glutamine-hydrolysing)